MVETADLQARQSSHELKETKTSWGGAAQSDGKDLCSDHEHQLSRHKVF